MEACLRYPWSLVAALLYVYLLITVYVLSDRFPSLKVLFGRTCCIISIALAVVAALFVGLAGDAAMTTSLPFVAVEALLMTTMGLSLMDDVRHLSKRPKSAVSAHLGVFLVLVAAVFGRGDKQKTIITAQLDQPVSEAGMPFMVTLKSFSMDIYEPEVLATSEEWLVSKESYMEMAMPDSIGYSELRHTGAVPAAQVKAVNTATGKTVEGWVSCGSYLLEPEYLMLPDGNRVFMAEPMPKKYLSRIEIYDAKGRTRSVDVSVNHPAKVGSWRIYQYNYDSRKGRWSTVSVFECVKDPWYVLAWPAMLIILLSSVLAFVGRRPSRKEVVK